MGWSSYISVSGKAKDEDTAKAFLAELIETNGSELGIPEDEITKETNPDGTFDTQFWMHNVASEDFQSIIGEIADRHKVDAFVQDEDEDDPDEKTSYHVGDSAEIEGTALELMNVLNALRRLIGAPLDHPNNRTPREIRDAASRESLFHQYDGYAKMTPDERRALLLEYVERLRQTLLLDQSPG